MRNVKIFLQKIIFFIPPYLLSACIFECKSYFLSRLSAPLRVDANSKNYLNVGSGSNVVSGFINIDFFGIPNVDYAADLRKPLKIPICTIDGVFTEHTLEHLTYEEVDNLLAAVYDSLKPEAKIRIILPDLSIFISKYATGDTSWFARWESLMFTDSNDPIRASRRLATELQAISFVTQEYGHVSAWDYKTIEFYLKSNGFNNIKQVDFRVGDDPMLLVDQDYDDRKFVSLYVEASK